MNNMKRSKKPRVSWPPGPKLCQVKVFRTEDSPANVASQPQRHSYPSRKPRGPDLPPGFEGNHYAVKPNVSNIPRIKWKRPPPKFSVNDTWLVGCGGGSSEWQNENLRISKVLEAIYPHRSAIPSRPSVSPAVEAECFDDSKTPAIRLTPIEDESESSSEESSNSKVESGVTANKQGQLETKPLCSTQEQVSGLTGLAPDLSLAASAALTALMKTKEQGSLVDTELLIKFLSDPKLIKNLITDTSGKSSETKNQPIVTNINSATRPVPQPVSAVTASPMARKPQPVIIPQEHSVAVSRSFTNPERRVSPPKPVNGSISPPKPITGKPSSIPMPVHFHVGIAKEQPQPARFPSSSLPMNLNFHRPPNVFSEPKVIVNPQPQHQPYSAFRTSEMNYVQSSIGLGRGPQTGVVGSDSMNHKVQGQDLSEAGPSGGIVTELSEIGNLITPVDRLVADGVVENRRVMERTPTIVKSKGYLVPNNVVAVGVGVGGGIKGLRPPVLKPPPAMKRPPIDHRGSSWDFLTHFAPSETVKRPSSSSSSSEDGCDEEEGKEEEAEAEEMGARFIQLGDTADETCSFTTNEGDSSSTVSNTSPIYPDGGAIITSWQKGQLLGRGSFGSVYEGISGDGDFFAVKEVSLLDQGSQAQECIQQLEGEIKLLSQLQHQNIVRYRGTAKDGSNLYIFLELVTQGSLLKLYQRYQLRDSVVSLYTRQILDGLKYLHDKGFIHRDIKCANILVDANGAVKLADFGLAKVSKFNDIKSCKGTPFWMAPEVINRKDSDGYGSPADIWSLGCTVLEMCTGQIPYSDLEPVQALFRIGRGTLPEVPDTLSLDARLFILKCLKVNPEERPTAAELLNHPFVRRPLPSVGSGGSGSASPLLRR